MSRKPKSPPTPTPTSTPTSTPDLTLPDLRTDDRASWDEIGMAFAFDLAKRSACARLQVGCAVIEPKRKRIIAQGYNGPVRRAKHCNVFGCNKNIGGPCLGCHAEINAIINCTGDTLELFEGATAYVNIMPCSSCMKHLANAGIARVVFAEDYERQPREGEVNIEPEDPIKVAMEVGIQLVQFNLKTKATKVIVERK